MMNMRMLCCGLLLASAQAWGFDVDLNSGCRLQGEYQVKYRHDAWLMTTGEGDLLRLKDGRLLFNGEVVPVDAQTRQALLRYEAAWKQVLVLGLDVGVEALVQVDEVLDVLADAFAELDPEAAEQMRVQLRQSMAEIRASLEQGLRDGYLDEKALERRIESAVMTLLPNLMGNAMRLGLKMALERDESRLRAFEEKMQALEPALQARFEGEHSPLREKIGRLCAQLVEIDELERAMALILPDGSQLDAVRLAGP